MESCDDRIFQFGEFRLIPAEGLLLRHQEPVPLSIKAFATLVFLVERHGHLVPKSDLLDEVWKDTSVEEGSISRCVWNLRKALGDKSRDGFIQTIPRRGYRFVCPVSVVTDDSGACRSSHRSGSIEHHNGAPQLAEQRAEIRPTGEFTSPLAESQNSDDFEQTLIAQPSRSQKLRRLATYALIGTILLIASLGYAFRNGPYLTRVSPSSGRGTTNEEAYQLYRQAENLSERRNQENIPVAMDYLNQSLTLDPKFARAWAAKALLFRAMADYPGADQAQQYNRSMDALGKALAIDPNLSEAYSALCLNKFRYEFDSGGAESACIRALKLDPDSSVGHKVYATFLYSHGRFDESMTEIKRALDLQPLALEYQQTYALALYYARRYKEEEAEWRRLIELNPTHGYIYTRLFINLSQQGEDNKAFDYLIKKLIVQHVDNEIIERFRTAFASSGWRGVTVERIKHPENESFTSPFDVACLYATVGDADKAFENLEKAYLEHSYRIAVLQVEPQLDSLRDDPRYSDLVRRIEEPN
jgi:DNA-binding winged helix-turn-helix (wHTH) protein/tetratricopeptide (TPR) repeat protein